MRRAAHLWIVCFIVIFASLTTLAQDDDAPPDYAITDVRYTFDSSTGQTVIEVDVTNLGGDADATARVELFVLETGQPIGSGVRLGALSAGDMRTVQVFFPSSAFPSCSKPTIRVTVGLGDVEAGTETMENNTREFPMQFPAADGTACASPPVIFEIPETITIPLINVQLDLRDPAQAALIAGVTGAILILLSVLLIIVRALSRKTPTFGVGRPPYAVSGPVDTNSVAGRRLLWQQHAQNGSLPPTCQEGAVHARKVLIGVDGEVMSGWRVKAIRMSQYDAYGRVAHSQVLASNGMAKRLDRAVRRGMGKRKDTPEQIRQRLLRTLRPVANNLVNPFKRRITARSASLPIALDVRLEGTHGEVRILFELYQCQYGQMQMIDGWEPEMTVVTRMIDESFTYTISGLLPGEQIKDFKRRLLGDVNYYLTEVVLNSVPPTLETPAASAPTLTSDVLIPTPDSPTQPNPAVE